MHAQGARVLSMSWGSASNAYTNDARYVDDFMWNYPDSLVLHAAGNSGQSASYERCGRLHRMYLLCAGE
jgi:hypothetical protein